MNDQQGTFIVIEGSDGSGKTTQLELMRTRLEAAGYSVEVFEFPRYKEPSSYFVRRYLSGTYGQVDQVNPYTASLFYALDRYESTPSINAALGQGKIVLVDRFVGSNMAHQGTKFRNTEERRGFFIWLDNLEFQMLGVPRPTLSIVLRVPVEMSAELLTSDADKQSKELDIHEKDINHLRKAAAVFDDLCQLFPKDFTGIDCTRDKKLLDVDTIHDIVWQKIQPLLPDAKAHSHSKSDRPADASAVKGNPYLTKDEKGFFVVTDVGKKFLASVVTNTNGNVYAFTDKLPSSLIATAMARRAHRVEDLRLSLLEDFASLDHDNLDQYKKTITEYIDDKIKQLDGVYLVVENASNLLTKKLEWGRTATYLELSSPYTFLDQRDAKGNYAYFTPPDLDEESKQLYRFHMDQIFDLYAETINKITAHIKQTSVVPVDKRNAAWEAKTRAEACRAASPLLPTATTTTVGIFASVQALEGLISHLLSDELPEALNVGEQMMYEARKVIPLILNKQDNAQVGKEITYKSATRESFMKLTKSLLPSQHSGTSDNSAVQLVDIWPRNELDLLPDMLYEDSSLSLSELRAEVNKWSYERKLDAFTAYVGNRENPSQIPGRALEKAHYSWDITCDYNTFCSIQRLRNVDDLEWQSLTPRYGYDTPKLVEEAYAEEEYEKCFEVSLKLFSMLQQKGHNIEAQYVTLLGHKLRWKVIYNAREAFHLHEQQGLEGNPLYRQLLAELHQKLAEVHPIIAQSMKFAQF